MSARDLKTELHERIEALTDEQTLRVYEFVSAQYGEEDSIATPEMLNELHNDLERSGQTNYSGITTSELQQKMHKWLTR